MDLIRDSAGNPAPELDKRDVPLAVMAQYMGVHPNTLYKQVEKGAFPKAAKVFHGSRIFYRPWLWVRVREGVHA